MKTPQQTQPLRQTRRVKISVAGCAECRGPAPPETLAAQTLGSILFPDKALVGQKCIL